MLGENGEPLDLFTTTDGLRETFGRIYLIDLEGLQHGRPQLDYVSELARETELWVDGGAETADEVMDLLVAGAERAVVSTARLSSLRELGRAWKLTQQIVVEVRIREGRIQTTAGDWPATPEELSTELRKIGIPDVLLGFHEAPVDWSSVQRWSQGGPTWVIEGSEAPDRERLVSSGATGAIFYFPSASGAEGAKALAGS